MGAAASLEKDGLQIHLDKGWYSPGEVIHGSVIVKLKGNLKGGVAVGISKTGVSEGRWRKTGERKVYDACDDFSHMEDILERDVGQSDGGRFVLSRTKETDMDMLPSSDSVTADKGLSKGTHRFRFVLKAPNAASVSAQIIDKIGGGKCLSKSLTGQYVRLTADFLGQKVSVRLCVLDENVRKALRDDPEPSIMKKAREGNGIFTHEWKPPAARAIY
uniref:Arrestin-like N-terminal domain-containing protein n=1 Tax=Chromera velia CCMP2878 TaxID=1169474 RepID=A0A0G4I8T3_9ALVE|eukprot:Cvel_12038.t1-p1 / transcript=Cvel_12038.t1 / gene=Cvel_12038 / organism=Chromera_velia_CCMP2878 / gene_product=hypothetical protein / transcript_product=hypothetical protein / location=Cvel_scaffold773:44832-46155(+) / protein_length=216 / sequence_SO=supercontig / SO=protein_coding / is_pseudo=false